MGKTVKIRNLVIGDSMPKICIPVMGSDIDTILKETEQVLRAEPDFIEWRADFFDGLHDAERVQEVLAKIRKKLENIPLLFTIRTKHDGGNADVTTEEYLQLNMNAIEMKDVDLLDVETAHGDDIAFMLIEMAHQAGKKVIASYHNFQETPKKEEMIMRLCKMQELEADIAKLAVMPVEERDVLNLLDATLSMKELHAETPVITMSMGTEGAISRVAGSVFGSAVTFGIAGKASAPGQIPAVELREILPYFAR